MKNIKILLLFVASAMLLNACAPMPLAQRQSLNGYTMYSGQQESRKVVMFPATTNFMGTTVHLMDKTIAYRPDHIAVVQFMVPPELRASRGEIMLRLTAYNDDRRYARAVWFEVDGHGGYINTVRTGPSHYSDSGVVRPGQQKTWFENMRDIEFSTGRTNQVHMDFDKMLRRPGWHVIRAWVSTYGRFGPGSWVDISLLFQKGKMK